MGKSVVRPGVEGAGLLVGSDTQVSRPAAQPVALSCLAALPWSRASEMGTAIYKLSGKINFQVKKTRVPGRSPLLLTVWGQRGHREVRSSRWFHRVRL